jgi:hypothetical protein
MDQGGLQFPDGSLRISFVAGHLFLEKELFRVSAANPFFFSCNASLIKDVNVPGTVHESEEIVSEEGLPCLLGRQPHERVQRGRKERIDLGPLGQNAFVDIEKEEMGEIQQAGFEHAHDLDSLQWIPLKRDVKGGHKMAENAAEDPGRRKISFGGSGEGEAGQNPVKKILNHLAFEIGGIVPLKGLRNAVNQACQHLPGRFQGSACHKRGEYFRVKTPAKVEIVLWERF